MRHGDRLEIGVAQWDVAHPELLEIDSLGGTAVELQHDRAARAGDDRRSATRDTAVPNADPDRHRVDKSDGNHASRKRFAVCELGSDLSARGSSCKRDAPTGNLVCTGDDLSLVAGLRVDEQEEDGVSSVAADAEQSLGRGTSPGAPGVKHGTRAPSGRNRRVEGNGRAAALDGTAERDRAGPGHSGYTSVSGGCRGLGRRLRGP